MKAYFNKAVFPTELHQQAADAIKGFFCGHSMVDTFLVVNSCARGQATPDSDLDFAVLVPPSIPLTETSQLEQQWQSFTSTNIDILQYKASNRFAQIHLDIIDGNYLPATWDDGGGPDYYEVEIGNRIAYSATLGPEGFYFIQLKKQWLPYYDEQLRLQRLRMATAACEYDLDHIPLFIKRGLYFQAFDRLYKAFQEFLQALFIARSTYPIAYNKWIKEQLTVLLDLPDLYDQLPPIISVTNINSAECNEKAAVLRQLLDVYCKS